MRRDLAIDATRGLAIWSMITAHFGTGTILATPTHSFPYVDGMSVFVMLSGLVLGMVYHRWIDRHTLMFAYRKLIKRLAVLYLCQLTIALVAVAAAMAGHRWLTGLLAIDSWADGLRLAVTMQYLPIGGNILLLYMILMASMFVLLPMLRRGWWPVVLGASLALYVYSQFHSPDWFYITAHKAAPRTENWAAWQIMFIPAVVVGWNWERWRLRDHIDRWLVAIVAAAYGVAMIFRHVIDTGPLAHLEPHFADKLDFAPARAIGAWIAVAAIYGVFRLVLKWMHRDWLRPLVMTGARSLDSYVIQAVALVMVPLHVAHQPWTKNTAAAAALLVFGLCWGWAEVRRAAHIDKLHRVPMILASSMSGRGNPRDRRRPAPDTTGDLSVAPDAPVSRSRGPEPHDPEPRDPDAPERSRDPMTAGVSR